MKKGDPPVVVEQILNAPVPVVWRAISEVDQMTQWYFENIPEFKAEVGFSTRFDVENEGRVFPHLWTVTEVVSQRKLVYDWRFDGYEGDSYVVFELSDQGDRTKVTVSAHVRESFQDGIPEFTRENCTGGWKYFIQQRLKEYLEQS